MEKGNVFSIVIPTYNRGYLLTSLLESLKEQTFKDFEVVICDDGSTDNTEEIVEQFAVNLDIKYIKLMNHGGPAGPRNEGIKKASGKYVAFLDSDDRWYSTKLEKVYNVLNHGYDWVYHSLDILTAGSIQGSFNARNYNKLCPQKSLLIDFNPIATSSIVIKKSLMLQVGYFKTDERYHFVEDFDYWLRLVKVNTNSFAITESLGIYNDHEVNNSKSLLQIDKLGSLYDQFNKTLMSKKVEISKKYAQFSLAYNSGNKQICYKLTKDMIGLNPIGLLTAKAIIKCFIVK